MEPCERIVDGCFSSEHRDMIPIFKRELSARHLIGTIASDESDQTAIWEFTPEFFDGPSDHFVSSDFDFLHITRSTEFRHPIGQRGPFDYVVDRPRGRNRLRDGAYADVLEEFLVVRVVHSRDDLLDVELRAGEL